MAGNKGAQQLLVLTAAAASAAAGCYFYSENHQNQNPKSGHPGHLKEMGHPRTDLRNKLASGHTSQHKRDSREDSNDTNGHEQGMKNDIQFARVPEEDYKREAEDAQEEKDLEDAKHDVIEKVFDDDAKKDVNYVISKIIF